MAASDDKHWLEPPEWWKKSKPLRWVPILIGLIGCNVATGIDGDNGTTYRDDAL